MKRFYRGMNQIVSVNIGAPGPANTAHELDFVTKNKSSTELCDVSFVTNYINTSQRRRYEFWMKYIAKYGFF